MYAATYKQTLSKEVILLSQLSPVQELKFSSANINISLILLGYQVISGQKGDDKSEHRHSGISELRRTGIGEFNSNDHYIYYCGQESIRRNGVGSWSTRVRNAVLGCNLKNDRMISVHFQGKPFNIMVIQVYALTSNTEKLKLNSSMKTYKTF